MNKKTLQLIRKLNRERKECRKNIEKEEDREYWVGHLAGLTQAIDYVRGAYP